MLMVYLNVVSRTEYWNRNCELELTKEKIP
jgi:hypothetical protein